MTKEEYVRQMNWIDAEYGKLHALRRAWEKGYMAVNRKFMDGQKVLVRDESNPQGVVAFIAGADMDRSTHDITYDFYKCKSNGAQSKQCYRLPIYAGGDNHRNKITITELPT